MDRISIDDIVYYAYHGVLPEERQLGQVFATSIKLGVDLSEHCRDDLNRVVDYRRAVAVVREIICGEPCRLLETLACRIAESLLEIPGILEAEVEVRKPNPPLPGVKGGIGVAVRRRKRKGR